MKRTKKSTLYTAIALVLCFSTLALTAFAATQNLTSYETLKNALLNFDAFENGTISMGVKMTDNDKEIISANQVMKLQDKQTTSTKSESIINGEYQSNEAWTNAKQTVFKNSFNDIYTVYNYINHEYNYNSSFSNSWSCLTATQQKLVNSAIDLAVGDLKNYFTSNKNTISINLQKNQIPQIAQLLVAVAAEQLNKEMEYDYSPQSGGSVIVGGSHSINSSSEMSDYFPHFSEDTEIKYVNMDVTLDEEKQISAISGDFAITTTDTDGTPHTLTFTFNAEITNKGTTIADTVDLTDKKVNENSVNWFSNEIPVSVYTEASENTEVEVIYKDSTEKYLENREEMLRDAIERAESIRNEYMEVEVEANFDE